MLIFSVSLELEWRTQKDADVCETDYPPGRNTLWMVGSQSTGTLAE